jgi:hypothetical protein
MIHYKKEGERCKIGLNITVGLNNKIWPWVSFHWAWYNVEKFELVQWRLRLRTWHPAYIYSFYRSNVIDNYLISRDLTMVSNTFVEDIQWYANKENKLSEFLERHNLLLETK